jgi:hypothetical protein
MSTLHSRQSVRRTRRDHAKMDMSMDDSKSQQQQQSDAASGAPIFGQELPPRSDIDEILRRKRKAREYKVCSTSASNTRERSGSLTFFSGVLPVPATQSQMRPECAVQDMRRSRTPRAMFLPSAVRSASTGQAREHAQHGAQRE